MVVAAEDGGATPEAEREAAAAGTRCRAVASAVEVSGGVSGEIFINYRRGDDPGNTGRLFDRLQDVFDPQQLFLDVDNIAPGLDFVRVLNERVGECDILLAVIGKSWIDTRDGAGKRRLEDPDDFVRIEIESAL